MCWIKYDWRVFSKMLNGYYYWEIRLDGKRIKKSLHRYIWEKSFWEIPKWYIIHHIDWNKDNNVIENFKLMNKSEHLKMHQLERFSEPVYIKKQQRQLDSVRHLSKERHASEEWIKRHKEHWKMCWTKEKRLKRETKKICLHCWKEYITTMSWSRFCCRNCNQNYKYKTKH